MYSSGGNVFIANAAGIMMIMCMHFHRCRYDHIVYSYLYLRHGSIPIHCIYLVYIRIPSDISMIVVCETTLLSMQIPMHMCVCMCHYVCKLASYIFVFSLYMLARYRYRYSYTSLCFKMEIHVHYNVITITI